MAHIVVIQTSQSALIGRIDDPHGDLFESQLLKFTMIGTSEPTESSKQKNIYVRYHHTLITEHNIYRVFQLDETSDISIRSVHHYFEKHAWHCRYRTA